VNLRVPSSCLLYETHWESTTKATAGCSTTDLITLSLNPLPTSTIHMVISIFCRACHFKTELYSMLNR
jgi:hypothetical protein